MTWFKRILAGLLAAVLGGLALVLGRKESELAAAKTELAEAREKIADGKLEETIQSLDGKVLDDDKDRLAKEALLRADLDSANSLGKIAK